MKDRMSNIIPVNECESGWLYKINARIGRIGICTVTIGEPLMVHFVVDRWKFKWHSLWPEIHWDCDNHYGTAQPYEKIEKVPDDLWKIVLNRNRTSEEEQKVLDYLEHHPVKLAMIKDEEDRWNQERQKEQGDQHGTE